ncbi:MAG: CBS domain-containing protein [Candidatus Micrarchaeota archaeon]
MGSDLKVGDIMTKKVIVISMGTNVGEAAKLMKKHSIGSLIIVDKKNGNKAKGIMTERDIVHKIIALKKNPYETTVDKIMSTPLAVVLPTTSIEVAAKAMRKDKVKRLPVVNDKDQLVGIISEDDIMKIFPAVIDLIEERVSLR